MADVDIDELGPVDYLVVEFPPGASHFTGEMAAELAKLVDSGTIRLLDLVILAKDADGKIDALEIEDLDADSTSCEQRKPSSPSCSPQRTSPTSPRPWNQERRPAYSSGRTAGPLLLPPPPDAPAASSSPADASRSRPSWPPSRPTKKETDMPLRPVRAARRGVIGAPVARTAAVVGTAAVVAHGVNRRQDRREDRRDDRRDRR